MRSVVVLSAVILTLCLSRFASACTNNSECTSATPFCSNQTCVACLVNAHCSSSTPHCTNQGTCAASPTCGLCTSFTNSPVCSSTRCVQCANNSQCASGVCDTTLKVCRPPVTCTNSTVCAGTDRPVCSGNQCVECSSDSDCSGAFPTCTAAGVCSAQKLSPILMCSKDATAGKRTLYTAFQASENVNLVYPVGSRNALYVNGQNVLLNSNEDFVLNGTRSHYYPQSFEALDISIDVEVTWYLDGSFSTLTLNSSSDCPTDVTFLVAVTNLTLAIEMEQNITDTIADALGVNSADVSIDFQVNKRSVQQADAGQFGVTVVNGFSAVLAAVSSPSALVAALGNVGIIANQVQGVTLLSETVPVFDTAPPAAPVASPTTSPVAAPGAAPTASPNAVPITPVAIFSPNSAAPSTDGVVATPGALDSGIIVAIVVVCVVVAAAVIIIAVVVSRNKKKKSGGGSSSRMERGSATELKETGSAATVTTANPAKKVESESSDEDEESGEDEDSSEEDEESGEEDSGSEVSGSGSNEGSSSAEGSGSNEGSSGSEESS